jgi:hypothetical protein
MAWTLFRDEPPEHLTRPREESAQVRRTKIAKDKIARGIHPANDSPTRPDLGTCGDCAHLVRRTAGNKRNLLKCPYHRLGTSSSEASDVRAGWPACIKFERRGDQ